MKKLMNYKNFVNEKFMFDTTLNENFMKGMMDKVWGFFKSKFKKASWLYYSLFMLKKDKSLSKKVEIFPYGSKPDMSKLNISEADMELSEEDEKLELEEKFEKENVLEAKFPLEHPDIEISNYMPSELNPILKRKFKMKLKYPNKEFSTFIWGAPGIGKTEVLKQVAEEMGVDLIVWHLATVEPVDFVGVPQVRDGRTHYNPPILFPDDNGEHGKGGILFFDELNRANEAVLGAALQLCQDGKVGEYSLPDKWLIVAAGNRQGEEQVTDLGKALGNRFSHYNLITSKDEWIDWAITKDYMDPAILGFIEFDENMLHHLDQDTDTSNWPSPRAWANVSMEYTEEKAEKGELSQAEVIKLFSPHVGNKAATAFAEYLKIMKLFSLEDIEMVYTDPQKAKILPERIDHAISIAYAISMKYQNKKLTQEQLANYIEYVARLDQAELSTPMLSLLKKVHPYLRDEEPWKTTWIKTLGQWFAKNKDVLKA